MRGFCWVLNPDVERELGAQLSYAVRAAFIRRIRERKALFEALTMGEEMVFAYELAPVSKPSLALFWCPSPHARAEAAQAGYQILPHPSLESLRKVHDKRFLSTALWDVAVPGRKLIFTEAEWESYRATTRGRIRVKRPFGYAGKGQRVWPEEGGRDDLKWLQDSLRHGGFIAEPNLEAAEQYSFHGFVTPGQLLLGRPCHLKTDHADAPIGIEPASDPNAVLQRPLTSIAGQVAEALTGAGYFGPFGIDVLLGREGMHLIDLNPRFTLGWSIGMGEARAAALELALRG